MQTVSPPSFTQRVLALLLLLLICATVFVLVDRLWFERYHFYRTRAEELQHRLLRLKRMAAMRPDLEKKIKDILKNQDVARQFLQGSSPALAAASLQQRIKVLVDAAGGEVLSAQVLPEQEEGNAIRVSVNVTVQGEVPILGKVLYGLESQVPLLFVEELRVTARKIRPRLPSGRRSKQTRIRLNCKFEVSGYLPKESS